MLSKIGLPHVNMPGLMQNFQNTYNVIKLSSGQVKSGSQITFNLPLGIYDMKNAIVEVFTNNRGSGIAGPYNIIYTRSDCFIPVNSFCQITKDQQLIANYQSLTCAQLEYYQNRMDNDDLISDYYSPGDDDQYPALTVKRWKRIAEQNSTVDTKNCFAFRFQHFYPFLLDNAEGSENRYLFIDKMLTIQHQLPTFDNSTFLAYQDIEQQLGIPGANKIAVVASVGPPVVTTLVLDANPPSNYYIKGGAPGNSLQPVIPSVQFQDTIEIVIRIKKINPNQYMKIERPLYQSYYTQHRSSCESDTINQNIPENAISKYQSLMFIPNNVLVTQFNFEDIYDQGLPGWFLRIQRQQCSILDAIELADAKSQALLWKENHKYDPQNLFIQFDEPLSDTCLQTTYSCKMDRDIYVVAGLQYFQKI